MTKHQDKLERKQTLGQYWLGELESAAKHFEKWQERSQKIVRRYRDERGISEQKSRQFNILWSNVQVMKPALYGRMPKPEVTRRFKDQDPIGRATANMLERCLEYEVEQYPDFDSTMANVVEDRLLAGRGTAWIRYEPNIVTDPQISEDVDSTTEHLAYECAPTDYVHWLDFCHTPARVWEEVWWVARRVYMTEEEGTKRFGRIFETVQLSYEGPKLKDSDTPKEPFQKQAEVWEIWDKNEKQVCWVAKGFDKELDVKTDPLQLEDFFPCPRPLYATVTTGSLVPVPDYLEYQDQAEELDLITARISKLTRALKVVGVYNAEYPAIKRMLQEGFDNDLIPVDAWAAFAEKKGLEGAVQMLQIKEVVEVLIRLYEARDQCKQVIYEIIGISDIIRGASEAQETLGAQQLKAQFGSMRMRSSQTDVARFATWLLKAKAHIISKFFSPKTIVQMSGMQYTMDAQLIPQALQLLKQGQLKDFRIEVAADSFVQLDEQKDKAERIEFLTAAGGFLKEALPVIQMAPQAGPLLGELLMFGVRGFKIGKSIEAAFEKAMAEMGTSMGQQGIPQEQVDQIVEQARQVEKQNAQRELGHIQKDYDLSVREIKVDTEGKLLQFQSAQDGQAVEGQKLQLEDKRFNAEREDRQVDRQVEAGRAETDQQALAAVAEVAAALNESLKQMLEVQKAPKKATRNAQGEIVISPTTH